MMTKPKNNYYFLKFFINDRFFIQEPIKKGIRATFVISKKYLKILSKLRTPATIFGSFG